jgi:hypothetical protein
MVAIAAPAISMPNTEIKSGSRNDVQNATQRHAESWPALE